MKDFTNNENFKFNTDKQLPFTVPQGYFDSLPSRIQDFCTQKQKDRPFVIFLQTVRTQLALAAGFAALAVLGYAAYYFIQVNPSPENELYSHDYIEIVSKSISDYDEGQLVEASDACCKIDTVKQGKSDPVIQYLLEEKIDYVTLMEQLQH